MTNKEKSIDYLKKELLKRKQERGLVCKKVEVGDQKTELLESYNLLISYIEKNLRDCLK